MNIRGIQKFTLVDFPGKIACIVFVGNCNFRCPYCHNPALVFDPESQPLISEHVFFTFLASRQGKLDGVVISGGEPSLRDGLPEFAARIRQLGFAVKIDTNGSNPDLISQIHREGNLDHLGVDYKAPAKLYNEAAACRIANLPERVHQLLKYAVAHKIDLDVRTTVHRVMLSRDHLRTMRHELDELGVATWTLQQFHPTEVIDDRLLEQETYSDRELHELSRELGGHTRVRGLKGLFLG